MDVKLAMTVRLIVVFLGSVVYLMIIKANIYLTAGTLMPQTRAVSARESA